MIAGRRPAAGGVVLTMNPVWKRQGGLAWSNPDASDSTRIRAALTRPRFLRLLDIAEVFGVERVRREWEALEALMEDPDSEVERASQPVERILHNIEEGFRRATAS